MRGVISFVLLLFLIESFFMVLFLNSLEYEKTSDTTLHTVKLLDFYDNKIKLKRELQKVLKSGSKIKNPVERIEYVSKELENFERFKELDLEYDIDLWCGYSNAETLDLMLISNVKPPSIQDMSSKVYIEGKEVHYCSTVLIYDEMLGAVRVGRNHYTNYFNLMPVIGFKIKSKDNTFIDIDYIEGVI